MVNFVTALYLNFYMAISGNINIFTVLAKVVILQH